MDNSEWDDEWEDDRDDDQDPPEMEDIGSDEGDLDDFDPNIDEDELNELQDFDPNIKDGESDKWDDFDPNLEADELDEQDDFDPNPEDDDSNEWEDFNPNPTDGEDGDWVDFNPNIGDKKSDFNDENGTEDIENIDAQSTVQVQDKQKIRENESEEKMHDEQEEVITPDPEEYEQYSEPLHDAEKADFVRDMQELSEDLKKASLEESEQENDDTAFNAEQAFDDMKERNNNKQDIENETAHEENLTGEVREIKEIEDVQEDLDDGLPEEISDQDEIDFLMQKFEDSITDGSSLEEIYETMQEAESIYEELKNESSDIASKNEESLDLSSETSDDDSEQVTNEHQAQKIVDRITELSDAGKTNEEISDDLELEEFADKIHELSETQDRENEQNKSIKEVQDTVEEVFEDHQEEITDKPEGDVLINEMEKLKEKEEFSQEKPDLAEKEKKIKDETVESIKERYSSETGKRHTYNKKNTKAFDEWLKKKNIDLEKIAEQKKEQDKGHDESEAEEWMKTILGWIDDLKDEEVQDAVKEVIKDFKAYEDLEMILRNVGKRKLSEEGKQRFNALIKKFKTIAIQKIRVYSTIKAFREYYQQEAWWNPNLIYHIRDNFKKQIYKIIKFKSTESKSKLKIITFQLPKDVEKTKQDKIIDLETLRMFSPLPKNENNNFNEWFTDALLSIMQQYEFLKQYASLRKISSFFGLSKGYLYDKKYKSSSISHEYLDTMNKNVSRFIDKITKNDKDSKDEAKKALNQLVSIMEIYRENVEPKLTANTQIDKKLNTKYFSDIRTIQQAYYLGLMFADGWITIQKTRRGSSSYRISISLKVEDKTLLKRFAEEIGLKSSRVLERNSIDHRTGKSYRMAYLQFGVGSTSLKDSMARDFIKYGMTYKKNKKGRRIKIPILPVFYDEDGNLINELMFAFLLGYFDGDGTLKGNNDGEIYSNNLDFFLAIKEIFNLGVIYESRRVVYDQDTQTHRERSLYSLYLNKRIMKKMMSLGLTSMERKTLDPETIDLESPIITKQRLWLKKVLPISNLREFLITHSPSRIASLIRVDHNTVMKFITQVNKLKVRDRGYYISLSYKIKKLSSEDELLKTYNKRTQYLKEIGKRNPFKA